MPLWFSAKSFVRVFRQRSNSRQRGGSTSRTGFSTSSSDTDSGAESPGVDEEIVREQDIFITEQGVLFTEKGHTPEPESAVEEEIIVSQSNTKQQAGVPERVIEPKQQASVELTAARSTEYSLSVEEEVYDIIEKETDPSIVSPQETSGTITRSSTKDEITDTDDLLPLQETESLKNSSSSEEYVIKTYTCRPITKMDVREALVGTNKKFECQVIGFPPPTIRWFKDNVEITHDPRYHFSHNHEDGVVSMHIEVIKLSDAGLYQCRAENCEGYAITAAHLQVKGW